MTPGTAALNLKLNSWIQAKQSQLLGRNGTSPKTLKEMSLKCGTVKKDAQIFT